MSANLEAARKIMAECANALEHEANKIDDLCKLLDSRSDQARSLIQKAKNRKGALPLVAIVMRREARKLRAALEGVEVKP